MGAIKGEKILKIIYTSRYLITVFIHVTHTVIISTIQTTEHLLSCYAWRCACLVSFASFLSVSTWFMLVTVLGCLSDAFFLLFNTLTLIYSHLQHFLPTCYIKLCILIRLMVFWYKLVCINCKSCRRFILVYLTF